MIKQAKCSRAFIIIWLFCAVITQYSRAGNRHSLMPENFNVAIRISNVSEFAENMRYSPLGKLLNDPEFMNFLGNPDYGDLLSALRGNKAESQEISRLITEDLKLLKGEFALYFITGSDNKGSIRLLAETGKDDYEKSLEINKRIAELSPDRTVFSTEQFSGVTVVKTVRHSEEDTTTAWQAHVKDTVAMSEDREWLEKTIIALKDKDMTHPPFPPVLEVEIKLEYVTSFLQNLFTSAQGKKQTPDADTGINLNSEDILEAIGLEKTSELTFSVKAGKSELEQHTIIKSRPGQKGIWAIFDVDRARGEQRRPFVPENLYSWQSDSINLAGLWNSIPDIIGAISPGSVAHFNLVSAMSQSMLGLDISADILTHLNPRHTTFLQHANGKPQSLLYWNLNNERAMADAIAKLFADQSPVRAILGDGLSTEDFRGYNLYVLNVGPATERSAIGVAVANENLITGEADLVRSALRSLASGTFSDGGFYRSDAYNRIQKIMPAEAHSYGFTDWAKFYRFYLADIIEKSLAEMQKSIRKQDSESPPFAGLLKTMDTSRMPDAEHIASFLGDSIHFSWISNDGIETKTIF